MKMFIAGRWRDVMENSGGKFILDPRYNFGIFYGKTIRQQNLV